MQRYSLNFYNSNNFFSMYGKITVFVHKTEKNSHL